ncbi:hypothetical protein TNCV_1817741 [Trichonephila clavipes]|nr:hypothetical protein TNCV_1817741 [Trichonephila clavipes]
MKLSINSSCQIMAFASCTRAFGDGLRNFKPWSSDERTTPELETPSPNYHTTPTGGRSALDRFNVHCSPTRRVFSGTGLRNRDKASHDPIP